MKSFIIGGLIALLSTTSVAAATDSSSDTNSENWMSIAAYSEVVDALGGISGDFESCYVKLHAGQTTLRHCDQEHTFAVEAERRGPQWAPPVDLMTRASDPYQTVSVDDSATGGTAYGAMASMSIVEAGRAYSKAAGALGGIAGDFESCYVKLHAGQTTLRHCDQEHAFAVVAKSLAELGQRMQGTAANPPIEVIKPAQFFTASGPVIEEVHTADGAFQKTTYAVGKITEGMFTRYAQQYCPDSEANVTEGSYTTTCENAEVKWYHGALTISVS